MRFAGTVPRPLLLLALTLTVAAGLAVQVWRGPAWSDAAGTILYAVAGYLVLALVRPSAPPAGLAVVTAALCVLVELAQLTGLPARLPALRLILGSTFSWADLPWYLVGAVLAGLVDRAWRRRRAATMSG